MLALNVEWKRPPLYRKQLDAIFTPKRISVIEASTKAGKTVGCATWLVEMAMLLGAEGREFWWVAPIYAQAKIAYKRIKRFLTRMAQDEHGNVHEIFKTKEGEGLSITLLNGAVIVFKGADNPDSLYGEDVWAAVIDEATRCKEETWHAIRSTLTATRGPVRIIGNVKGRKNWAFQLARKAEIAMKDPEDKTWHYAKLTAYDAVDGGVLDPDEIKQAKESLPEQVFKELYEAEPGEDEGNPFGIAAIKKCVKPFSTQEAVAWGWDLAKSVDWTVGIALDARGEMTRFERWQGLWTETTSRIAAMTTVPALVDSTGVGDPIVESLQKVRDNIFEGFKFTSSSKQQLMEGLALDIQQGNISFTEDVVDELESFEYVMTRTGVRYSAPEGFHDDKVCALALAAARRRSLSQILMPRIHRD